MSLSLPAIALGQAEPAAPVGGSVSCTGSTLSWVQEIGALIADIVQFFPRELATLAVYLSSMAIGTVNTWSITSGGSGSGASDAAAQAFTAGWTQTRNLANMLVVLAFVIIGISTALRIREYEAKKMLLPLIVVALLINFSGLFCGLIIDASNLTMKGLTMGAASMGTGFMTNVQTMGNKAICAQAVAGNMWGYIAADVMFSIVYVAIAICFIYLAFMLLARYAVLGILYMLSPLAFVFWAFPFPKAKELWNQWWSHFIKWSFIGVGICFFLWLAQMILAQYQSTMFPPVVVDLSAASSPFWGTVFYLFVVLMVIFVGIKISTKSSAIGAAAVIGLATGGIGMAMGAAGKAASGGAGVAGKGLMTGADKLSGGKASAVKQSVSGTTGRFMENIGLKQTGTTAKNEAARVSAEQKGMEAALNSGNATDKARVQALAKNGHGIRSAAAMGAIASAGQINETFKDNATEAGQRLQYASQFGGENLFKTASKENPLLMASNTTAIKGLTSQTNPSTGINYTAQEAEDKLVGGAYRSADIEARSKFSPDVIKDRRYLENTTAKQMLKAGERMSADRVQAHKDLLARGGMIDQMRSDPANASAEKQAEITAKEAAIVGMS